MNTPLKFCLFFSLVFIFSCKNDSGKSARLSEDQFVNILVDIHKADALVAIKNFYDKNLPNSDTASYYNFIFVKHKVSRFEFDNTVSFFIENPKEYVKLYNKVIKKLEAFNNDGNNNNQNTADNGKKNLWQEKAEWKIPQDGNNQTIPYKIMVTEHGVYKLNADIVYYPDDLTKNPKMSLYAYYTNGTYDYNLMEITEKSGKWKNYSVIIKTDNSKHLEYISGWILDHATGTENKHCDVKNIRLIRDDN